MTKVIGIGFLGMGVIGSGLLSLIKDNKKHLLEKYNIVIDVKAIFVRDIHKKRSVNVSNIHMTTNAMEVIENPEIDVCIECMGGEGIDYTLYLILNAIKNKKNVVMSSKKCLALYTEKIMDAVYENDVQLRVEATVGGAIPICRALMHMSKCDEINKIYGVVNGTSNYILSSIENSGNTYENALQTAINEGFTENNPFEDVDGWDAVYKMSILVRLGMKIDFDLKNVKPLSISNVKRNQVEGKDFCTKQIFYAEKSSENVVNYFVGPMNLSSNSLLSKVSESYNMVLLENKYSGIRAFYGRGAGGVETASVMLDDLIDIICYKYQYEPAQRGLLKRLSRSQVSL